MSLERDLILHRVKNVALGNTRRGLKEVASDLVNELGKNAIKDIEQGTYLCRSTIERVMDCDSNYRPQAETLERIFRYCNASIVLQHVENPQAKFRNKPKDDSVKAFDDE
jgi:hypothetical protein